MAQNTKPMAALIITMFVIGSAHATCPNLDVCIKEVGPLLKGPISDPRYSPCCSQIGGIVGRTVDQCLCKPLQRSLLGSLIAAVLGLLDGLPIIGHIGLVDGVVGGVVGGVGGGLGGLNLGGILGGLDLGGLLGGLPIVGPLLGPVLVPIYGLNSDVLDADVLALVKACGFNPNNYKCSGY